MAGLQNSGRACWNFGWFCHHQKNKEAGNDCDSAKRMVSQLDEKMVEFLIFFVITDDDNYDDLANRGMF